MYKTAANLYLSCEPTCGRMCGDQMQRKFPTNGKFSKSLTITMIQPGLLINVRDAPKQNTQKPLKSNGSPA